MKDEVSFILRLARSFILHPSSFILFLACASPEPSAVRDDLGRSVGLRGEVRRIVTLAPNVTELVFAIGAGERVVGTDQFSDRPDEVRRLPKVGGMQPDVEKIAGLRPDLVIATTSGNHPNLAPALESARIPLFVVRTERLDEIPKAMLRLGEVLDAPEAADAARRLSEAIAKARRARARPPRVLFVVWPDPLYVAGQETFAGDLIALAGGTNAVTAKGWPQYSLETLVADPPDIIVHPAKSVSRSQAERLLERIPGRARVRLETVDENRFTRPSPHLAEAAAELNAIMDAWESAASPR